MSARQDPRAVRMAKAALPPSVKTAAEQAIRLGGAATARFRPGPDFLIIGTKRGGTTSLWRSLSEHPQVMGMVPAAKHLKSPHYFYWHHQRGPAWYRGHFPTTAARTRHAARHGRAITGEASPMYLWDPRVPERVAAELPEARILITLRDPVLRAHSHWKERVKEGVETLSFEDALDAEEGRLAGELDRMHDDPAYYSRAYDWYSYRSRGDYAEQLLRWWQHVPRQQTLVLRAEDCHRDQPGELRRVHEFLGLDPSPVEPIWANRTTAPPIAAETERALRLHYQPGVEQLAQLLDTNLWWPDPATPTRNGENR